MSVMLPFCLGLFLLVAGGSTPLRAEAIPERSKTGFHPELEPTGDLLSRGLWWLYHVRYDQARDLFSQYIAAHPEDPAGYFFKTATDWWHLAQEFDYDLPEVRERFEQDYQDTVRVAQAALKKTKDPAVRARILMYWGGAEGLKGRWLVTQQAWLKAYFLGRRGHALLQEALKEDPSLYDAYMGIGIYDYYTDALSGVQALLSAIFIRGDRQRGLRELQLAIENGERCRVEAETFLIQIYVAEEKTPEKALPIARGLQQRYPLSPAMQMAHIMVLYHLNDYAGVEAQAKDFLEKSEKETPYFTREGIRPAHYCLGVAALFGKRDPDLCFQYMTQILDGGIDSSRWVTFAYLRRGEVYDLRGEREKAIADYRTVLARKDYWGAHEEARRSLRTPFKY